MEKSWPGAPSPRAIFTAHLFGKKHEPGYDKLPLSSNWNISLRMLCVTWLDLARLGKLIHVKPFTRERVGSPPTARVTLSCQPSDPTPRARFAVSHVNGWRWFISNCRKTGLACLARGEGRPGILPSLSGETPRCEYSITLLANQSIQ